MNGAALLIIIKSNDEPRSVGETMMLLFLCLRSSSSSSPRSRVHFFYLTSCERTRKDTLSVYPHIKKKDRDEEELNARS